MQYALPLFIYLAAFRAFVVPTGSMAPTIVGNHKEIVCPECGIHVRMNASREGDPIFGRAQIVTGCTCVNCQRHIDFKAANLAPTLRAGDRLFVTSVTPKEVKRYDVLTHIYPEGWYAEKRETLVWLTRVMGLPGETLALQEGRLYRAADINYKTEKVGPDKLWRKEYMHIDDPQALKRFEQGKFEIVRPSPDMLLSQRRLVYDNDFAVPKTPPAWMGGKGAAWKSDNKRRSFEHGGIGTKIEWLNYRHLRATEGGKPKPSLIMDEYAYNNTIYGEDRFPDLNWVGDLLLECAVTIAEPDGELWLDLTHGNRRYQARFKLKSGQCTLVQAHDRGGDSKLGGAMTALKKAGTYRLRFANCDNRLTLWINDELAFGDGIAFNAPDEKGPTKDDLEPARIGSLGAAITVQHLRLWRNQYYSLDPVRSDVERVDGSDPATWDALSKPPVRTFYVQPGHYFFMGDNPSSSHDSRNYGVVSHNLLGGRVVMCYWPPERVRGIR